MAEIRHKKSGVVLHRTPQESLQLAGLAAANLPGADLRSVSLCNADLRGANLTGADLSFADLSGADLRDAILAEADLRGANLCGARLQGTDMTRILYSRTTRYAEGTTPFILGTLVQDEPDECPRDEADGEALTTQS